MPSRPRVLALILAGGKGSRLGPLTQRRAKPALPFGGVYRLVDFPLSHCVHSGLADVWVVEQYQPHALNEHLLNGRPWDLDRNRGGLRILPPFTGAHGAGFAEGNADALWRQRRLLEEFAPDVLVVCSADHVYRLDVRSVLDAHAATRAAVTMVTAEVDPGEASRFGVVDVHDGGRVRGFAYKPERPGGGTVTAEVFAYDAPRLLRALDELAAGRRDAAERGEGEPHLGDFGDHLLPRLVSEGDAYAFALDGYWRDVGTVESYWRGHMELLGDDPSLVLDDAAWPILSAGTRRMPARLARGARVDEALVSSGARVAGTVERSVVGPGVVVEAGAVVRDAVLLDDVVVRRGARVTRAVLDEGVEVGADAHVGADAPAGDAAASITVIGGFARVRAGSTVDPGTEIDAVGAE
jgi:glucose-1-phosphate adenylyltransferase